MLISIFDQCSHGPKVTGVVVSFFAFAKAEMGRFYIQAVACLGVFDFVHVRRPMGAAGKGVGDCIYIILDVVLKSWVTVSLI